MSFDRQCERPRDRVHSTAESAESLKRCNYTRDLFLSQKSMEVALQNQRALLRAQELLALFDDRGLWTLNSELVSAAKQRTARVLSALDDASSSALSTQERRAALEKLRLGAFKSLFERSSSQLVKVRSGSWCVGGGRTS